MRAELRNLLVCVMASVAVPVFAHSTVKSTSPASGSILSESPSELVIEFEEPVRMISVETVWAGKVDRKLEFSPTASARVFKVQQPKLQIGRNEIQWKALSEDGHPVSGTLILVVKPGTSVTPPSVPEQPPLHEHR